MRRRDLMHGSLLSLLPWVLPASKARAAAAPVVLELFTSEGCSSCPPADALLGVLAREANVIGLAWHVDYWNGLGWQDPFARPAWTERQRAYARALNTEVYTPALVVNGATMVVGSDAAAVREAMARAAPLPISVTLRRDGSGLTAEITAPPAAATGLLVSYDARRETPVHAGENSGRSLVEYRIVREASPVAALAPRLALPPAPEGRGVALLLLDQASRVIGAADLPPGDAGGSTGSSRSPS